MIYLYLYIHMHVHIYLLPLDSAFPHQIKCRNDVQTISSELFPTLYIEMICFVKDLPDFFMHSVFGLKPLLIIR